MYEKLANGESHKENKASNSKIAVWVFTVVEAVITILFALFVEWGQSTDFAFQETMSQKTIDSNQTFYPIFQDINVMMFIGFGFLMTYLRSHSWSSVGINFLATVFAIQIYIVVSGFWKHIFENIPWSTKVPLSIETLITSEFAAAAVLITLGGILGKVSPYQMLLITLLEVIFYSLDEAILNTWIKVSDAGGSVIIHTFGAFFGLTVSMIITNTEKARNNKHNSSSYNSNLFAMIGTLFLWMFWPSFNSAFQVGNGQQRTQITTILSLTGSALSTFLLSAIYKDGKFHMEDILNATLAGGVMIGASSNLVQHPFAAIVVGFLAGIISTFGFEVLSGFLQEKIELFDTAGIHNLHGLPGFLGGIISAIFAGLITQENFFEGRTSGEQAKYQIIATVVCLAIAVGSGILTGFIAKGSWLNPPEEYFLDSAFWEISADQGFEGSSSIPATEVHAQEKKASQKLPPSKENTAPEKEKELQKEVELGKSQ